jgi:hypothetical protein
VLPSVVDPIEAVKSGAPAVWAEAPDNIVAAMSYGDAAKVEEAFANAAHKVSLDLVSQRLVPSAMEPRSTIAEIEKKTGRLILHVQSQTPGSTRDLLAESILKRPKESVRVLVGDIGGGFGQKTSLYPEDGVVAYAATKLVRKIRWRGDRTDEFVGGTHGRDLTSTGEFALDAKGRVLAYRVRSVGGTGAYLSGTGTVIPLVLGPFVQSGVYDLPLVHYDINADGTIVGRVRRKTFGQAALQIIVADVSMSLDNVLAVAGAAREHPIVLGFGLLLSIGLMGVAANVAARLLEKHRWIAYVGLAVILYVACEMIYRGVYELKPMVKAAVAWL